MLTEILQRPDPPDSAAALQVHADEATRAISLATLFPIWQDLVAHHSTRHAEHTLGALGSPDLADATIRSPAWPALAARLRRLEHAGIDPAAALAEAATQETLNDADDLAAVLHWRLRHTETTSTNPDVPFTQLTPQDRTDLADTARQVAAAMDARTAALAHDVEANPPPWVEALGPRPTNPAGRQASLARAGIVAGYREAFGITTVDDPIGPTPAADRVDAHAWWTRAAAALTNSPAHTLATPPAERLEAIIDHAHTHLAQAPPSVAHQLRDTAIALRHAHTRAGTAIANGHTTTANITSGEAARLGRKLDQLEHAQTLRDRWNLTAARLDSQAVAALALLDHRRANQQNRPYNQADTTTLIRRLRAARHRAGQATAAAERHDRQAEHSAALIADLQTAIDHTTTSQPAQNQARQTVLDEQRAATRMATIQAALAATRLGRNTIRGHHRALLTGESTRYASTPSP